MDLITMVEDCLWNKNFHGVDYLNNLMRCIPSQFLRLQHLMCLTLENSMLEKLWEGVQVRCLVKAFTDWLSWSIRELSLNGTAIEEVLSTIGNLNQLETLDMIGCTALEVLPTDVNWPSLQYLVLSGCKRLRSFSQISWSIKDLWLNDTDIEEVPSCIENFSRLTKLSMRGCKKLKNISPNIFRLTGLLGADFSECVEVGTALGDATLVEITEDHFSLFRDPFSEYGFKFNNCFSLDGDARELILRLCCKPTFLPGGRVPKYFTHQSSRQYLTVTLPQSSLSQEFLRFKTCVIVEPITNPKGYYPYLVISWYFRGDLQQRCLGLGLIYNTDHLVLVPLKFRNIAPRHALVYNDVVFEFSVMFNHANDWKLSPFQRIKGCGIRVMKIFPSPASSDASKKPMEHLLFAQPEFGYLLEAKLPSPSVSSSTLKGHGA